MPGETNGNRTDRENSSVNGKTTDAVTTITTLVVGMAPAMAMGNLYQTLAYNVGLAAMNQVFSQYQANINHQAITIVGIQRIFSK
ncbi:RebB family R body protein [Spartinivicinus poritis]|uniref:RebB family R body protein n=1 Tax=Spartinivicinus poritis TaxID=2994640 RepID=A0ABT5U718_9GAMM|nr:RebB family R body protein [Spartinivicinus sp. A2-2]MDE1462168.1 RebB family R body protein [Spartinivicinus sp. A2-2]